MCIVFLLKSIISKKFNDMHRILKKKHAFISAVSDDRKNPKIIMK